MDLVWVALTMAMTMTSAGLRMLYSLMMCATVGMGRL